MKTRTEDNKGYFESPDLEWMTLFQKRRLNKNVRKDESRLHDDTIFR